VVPGAEVLAPTQPNPAGATTAALPISSRMPQRRGWSENTSYLVAGMFRQHPEPAPSERIFWRTDRPFYGPCRHAGLYGHQGTATREPEQRRPPITSPEMRQ